MRILIISQYFWPENFKINDLTSSLVDSGHDVTVLTGMPNYPVGKYYRDYSLSGPYREEYSGARIQRVPMIARGSGSYGRLALNYASFAMAASVRAAFLSSGPFDVIFAYQPSPVTVGIPAVLASHFRDVPIVMWVQDLWPESVSAVGAIRSPRLLSLIGVVVDWIYEKCARILVTSRGYIDSIKARGVRPDKIGYLPQWPESIFKPPWASEVGRRPDDLPDGFIIMYTGNIGTAQSFETIVEAAERTKDRPEVKWVIIGDGRRRAWLQEQVEQRGLGDTVRLLGRKPLEEMPRYTAHADSLVLSLGKNKLFSLVLPAKLQTYMASGRPVLASIDGEAARIVEEAQAGIAFPAEDADALAQAAKRMQDMDATDLERMAKNGAEYCAREFDRAMLIKGLEKELQKVVDERR